MASTFCRRIASSILRCASRSNGSAFSAAISASLFASACARARCASLKSACIGAGSAFSTAACRGGLPPRNCCMRCASFFRCVWNAAGSTAEPSGLSAVGFAAPGRASQDHQQVPVLHAARRERRGVRELAPVEHQHLRRGWHVRLRLDDGFQIRNLRLGIDLDGDDLVVLGGHRQTHRARRKGLRVRGVSGARKEDSRSWRGARGRFEW